MARRVEHDHNGHLDGVIRAVWSVGHRLNDKTLRAEAGKMQLDVDPMTGDELQKLVSGLYATAPRLIQRARLALASKPLTAKPQR